ncbi:MAG: tRNA dimethylallyltransferase, partial [uncultured Phycisphaerae bacterium]
RQRPQAARAGAGGVRADREADLVVPDALDEPRAAAPGGVGRARLGQGRAEPPDQRPDEGDAGRRVGGGGPVAAGDARPTQQDGRRSDGVQGVDRPRAGAVLAGGRRRADQDRHPAVGEAADEVVPPVPRRPVGGGGPAGRGAGRAGAGGPEGFV